MVVHQEECSGALRDRLTEDLTRVDQRTVEDATADQQIALQSMLGVEDGDVKLLHAEALKPRGVETPGIVRPAHRRPLRHRLPGESLTELECRADHGRAHGPDPGDPSHGSEGPLREAGERSPGSHEEALADFGSC